MIPAITHAKQARPNAVMMIPRRRILFEPAARASRISGESSLTSASMLTPKILLRRSRLCTSGYVRSVSQFEMVFRVTNTAFASSPWDIPSRSRCSLMRFASSTRIPSNLEVSGRGNCTIEPVWRARCHAKMACQKICATMLSWHVFEQTVGAAACTRELVVLELREEAFEASRPEGRIHADRTHAIRAYSRRTGIQVSLYALRSAKRNAGNSTILYSLVCPAWPVRPTRQSVSLRRSEPSLFRRIVRACTAQACTVRLRHRA